MVTPQGKIKVGVLALQGDFAAHEKRLQELGAETVQVRTTADTKGISGLAMPGGESSAMLRLLRSDMRERLLELIGGGLPALATCAGVILLAKQVTNPEQESLGLLDVDVKRNAYGRQTESFIASSEWTKEAEEEFKKAGLKYSCGGEAVFIRAPIITRTGGKVVKLSVRSEGPTLVRENNIIAATFHPELSEKGREVHQYFLALVKEASPTR